MSRLQRLLLAALPGLLFLSACVRPAPLPSPTLSHIPLSYKEGVPPPTYTPFQPLPPDWTQTPALPSPLPATETATLKPDTPAPPSNTAAVWVDPSLPAALHQAVTLPDGFRLAKDASETGVHLKVGEERVISRWVYALTAPFPTTTDDVTGDALRRRWQGEKVEPFGGQPLLVDESTLAVFSARWGQPASGAVQVHPSEELIDAAWNMRPSWAIVPFEALQPRWKVIAVDGRSPVRKDFQPEGYPLTVPLSLSGESALLPALEGFVPASNRDPGKLTVLVMTGVTALVRATAYTMERQGILYPGQDIRDWLINADLTHISNEVPFAEDCPYPNPVQEGVVFCSDPRYLGLLEDVGTDIVELTGDHFHDWGSDAMLYTLQLYQEKGWGVYGGGANLDEARKALTVEHNGNRLAFIGCNAKGGVFAQASATSPGSGACDLDWMAGEITRLRAAGYLPVATFQHFEYYTYTAQPNQIADSRKLTEAGAVIVSGSQAHQPQGMEFLGSSFIHYGLGNLFFDQYNISDATRQGFIDRHIFYDGRYLGTELLTIQFIDYARPRPMTETERNALLNAVFSASGW